MTIGKASGQGRLFPASLPIPGMMTINPRVTVRTAEGHRVVTVDSVIFHAYRVGDRMAETYAMVMLVEGGYADQNDIALAFGRSARTLRRDQERFAADGLKALGRQTGRAPGARRGDDVGGTRDRTILRLRVGGTSNRMIAEFLGLDEKTVRRHLRKLGWKLPDGQGRLFSKEKDTDSSLDDHGTAESAACGERGEEAEATDDEGSALGSVETPLAKSFDADPLDRSLDRLLAAMGVIDDAPPVFASASNVSRAGVLLAIPSLVKTDLLSIARGIYGSIGPAFYGLRTTIVALVLLALLRIKRPEALKEYAPAELGRIVGLDRVPEVKTLRRKLTRLAKFNQAEQLGRELAKRRVADHGQALGFLYVDGHVRVYHGKHTIPKTHVTQMRISLPATTDYWVNDQRGDPLFVVTAEANASMTKMLPGILAEIRGLLGSERRITTVFDRGGWSPKLFAQLLLDHFDILTYRKGKFRHVAKKRFVLRKAVLDGRPVEYLLDDRAVRFLKGKLRLRQVTRLNDSGHQTAILTSRWDLRDVVVAFRMFERWRQENFFKYLRQEFAIDALTDYQVEPDDPTRSVPNPAWRAVDKDLRKVRASLAKLKEQFGTAAAENEEEHRPTMRGFKIANANLGKQIRAAQQRAAQLQAERSALARRVPIAEALQRKKVVKLATERKHLTNILKLVAYQIESELVAFVTPHYARAEDEARTLVQAALLSSADLVPTNDELLVTLAAQSSPHRSRAIAALCDSLNETRTCFPGTRLQMRYTIGQSSMNS